MQLSNNEYPLDFLVCRHQCLHTGGISEMHYLQRAQPVVIEIILYEYTGST